MHIFDGVEICGRVSSLFVQSSSGMRGVEVGWYENPTIFYRCLRQTISGGPRELAVAFIDNAISCQSDSPLVPDGEVQGFRVYDANQNGVWRYVHGGEEIWQSPDMGTFVTGILSDNGERLGNQDHARSNFDGLMRMINASDWAPWDGTVIFASQNDDPGYKGCKDTETHT